MPIKWLARPVARYRAWRASRKTLTPTDTARMAQTWGSGPPRYRRTHDLDLPKAARFVLACASVYSARHAWNGNERDGDE